jgi:hypothetical protein
MDDGASNLARCRAMQTAPNLNVGAGRDQAYAETGTNIYVVCRSL